MSNIPKNILRSYIKKQNFKNSTDILPAIKEIFREVLQEALEIVNFTP